VAGERVWFDVPTLQEFGGPDAVPTTPAQLQVFAFDGASGVGAVSWRGNQGATAAVAGLTLKAFSAGSLVLVGGAVWDATAWDAAPGAALVGAVTNQMGVLVGKATAAGNVTVQSNATARSWEMVGIEVLPRAATPPTRRFLALGDSGVESNDSNLPWPVRLGELLGPDWAMYGGGVWWAYSGQTRARWDTRWSAAGPWDVVAVHVGANDVLDHGVLDQASWVALMDAISATGTKLLVQTIEATQWYGEVAAVDAADQIMRSNVPRNDGVFDFTVLGSTAAAARSNYLSADGVHWNDAGNALIAAEYARMVATLAAAPPRALPASTAR
jgi:lysophospholipase L1-like esterase